MGRLFISLISAVLVIGTAAYASSAARQAMTASQKGLSSPFMTNVSIDMR